MRLIGDRSRGRDVLRGEMISNVLYNGRNEMQESLDTESQSDCRARRLSWGKGRCGMRVSKTRSQLGDLRPPRNHCGKWLQARKLPRFIWDNPLSAGSCIIASPPPFHSFPSLILVGGRCRPATATITTVITTIIIITAAMTVAVMWTNLMKSGHPSSIQQQI